MSELKQKIYNAEYYDKNKKRLMENRRIKYKTDLKYRTSVKKRANLDRIAKNILIDKLKKKYKVTTLKEVLASVENNICKKSKRHK